MSAPSAARQVAALARETLLQGRGRALWIVFVAGGAAALLAGYRLPGPEGSAGSLAPLLYHGAGAFLFTVAALTAGAHALAGDRDSGFRDLLGSKPIASATWFLGRFCGLGLRFTATFLLFALGGGAAMSVFEDAGALRLTESPASFTVAGAPVDDDAPRLVPPDGTVARWRFDASDGELRFTLRARYPKGKPLRESVPLNVLVESDGRVLLEREINVLGRKEFSLPFLSAGDDPVGGIEAALSIAGGHNYLEASRSGCRLARGAGGPIQALLLAAFSFLPVLWASLALALLFSAIVSEPTAFLAAGVLVLITFFSPALEKEFRLIAAGGPAPAGSHAEEGAHPVASAVAVAAGKALVLFPDPGAGGGMRPLSRGECPGARDVGLPWRTGALHLLAILLAGCLLASWRRP